MRTLRLLCTVLAILIGSTLQGQDSLAFGIEENKPLSESVEEIKVEKPAEPVEPVINTDSLSDEIIQIMDLLETREMREMVITARSQKKQDPKKEMAWYLTQLDEKQVQYVLRMIKLKAGSRLKPKNAVAEIYWESDLFNFGAIREGRVVKHTFVFENIGKVDYQIKDVLGSCYCTISNFPKEPIPPGGKGQITISFNSKDKKGENTEFITVEGNTHPKRISLLIEGKVY